MADTFDTLAGLQDQMTPEQHQQYKALNAMKQAPRRINYPAALDFFRNKRAKPDEILGGAAEFAKAHMGAESLEAVYGVGKVPQDHAKIAEDFAGIVNPYVNFDSVVYQTREQFEARTLEKAEELKQKRIGQEQAYQTAVATSRFGHMFPSMEDRTLVEHSFKTEDFIDEAQEALLKEDRLANVTAINQNLSPDTLNKARLSAFLADDTAAVSEIAATVPVDERADFAALIQLSTPAEHNVLKYFAGEEVLDDIIRAGRRAVAGSELNRSASLFATDGVPYNQISVYSELEKGLGKDNLAAHFKSDAIGGYGPDSYASPESREQVAGVLRDMVTERYRKFGESLSDVYRIRKDFIDGQVEDLLQQVPSSFAQTKEFFEAQDLERQIQNAMRPRRPDEIGLLFDITAATMELAPFTAGTALATFAGGPTAGFAFAFSAQKDSINSHYQQAGFDPGTADMMSSTILVPISALEYLGASRFFKTGLAKGLVDSTGRNYWRISGQLLAQRGVGFAEEVLTEGGQRFLEDIVLVAAQEHADIEGLTVEEVMSNAGEEMQAAFKGMAGLMLVPGVRDQGFLAAHKLTQGRASLGEVGTFLDLEKAMAGFSEQRQQVIDRHKLDVDEQGNVIVDVPGPDGELIVIPAGAYDAWKTADSAQEQDSISEQYGASREHMEILQEREVELQNQVQQKIGEIAFNTAVELNSSRAQKVTERIQSRLDDGATVDAVLAELIQKYAPGQDFNVVTVNGVEDLLLRDDVSDADKVQWTQYRERTGKWPAIEGFVSGGTAFLVKDNFEGSPAKAVAKFAHEALGHLGVDAQGQMRDDVLTEAAVILEEGGFLQSWAQMLINLNPEFYGPQFTTDGALDPLKLADEVISRIAEGLIDGRDLSVQQRNAWQKIRDFTGKQLGIETAAEWTDRSMAELVSGLMRGGRDAGAGVATGTRFSVAPDRGSQEYQGLLEGAYLVQDGDFMPMYHGSPSAGIVDFEASERGVLGPGVYMTPFDGDAGAFGDNIYQLVSSIKNPKVIATVKGLRQLGEGDADLQTRLEAEGFDGVVHLDEQGDVLEATAFNPEDVYVVQSESRFSIEADTEVDRLASQIQYPLAPRGEWYDHADYKATNGKLVVMSPDEFLQSAKPLERTENTRENVDDLKTHIEEGRALDPLTLYPGPVTDVKNSDGRHRAIAAQELGFDEVPVLDFRDSARFSMAPPVESEAFKNWFGDSKVVDGNGEPLVVYHGTGARFTEFEHRGDSRTGAALGIGFYFATDRSVASGYERGEGQVMDAYLSIQNPLDTDAEGFSEPELAQVIDRLIEIELETYGDELESFRDGFLSNLVDTYSLEREDVSSAAAGVLFVPDELAVDQLAGLASLYGERVQPYRAVQEALGFDGFYEKDFQEEDGDVYVAWFPEQIKSATENVGTFDPTNPDIRYSLAEPRLPGDTIPAAVDSLGFYSMVERRVSEIRQEVFSPTQLANQIRKLPGVKKEELDDLGLLDWLDGKEGRVTKAEVLEFIRSAGPQMTEVTLTGDVSADEQNVAIQNEARQAIEDWAEENGYEYDDRGPTGYGYVLDPEQEGGDDIVAQGLPTEIAQEQDIYYEEPDPQGVTKFSEYTLPGGENYREVLLTLPAGTDVQSLRDRQAQARKDIKTQESGLQALQERGADTTLAEGYISRRQEEIDALQSEIDKAEASGLPTATFQSSHFDEPNILAHMRINDRVDARGNRVLFIEEIQSDWHQAGKKKGYVSDEPPAGMIRQDQDGRWKVARVFDPSIRFDTREDAVTYYNENVRSLGSGKAVPDAPLKKTESWALLAFKRILRQAVEQGYDAVAWTPGDIQNERYDLSRTVKNVNVVTTPNQRALYITLDGNRDATMFVSNEGVVTEQSGDLAGTVGNDLEDVIGEDLTRKVMATEVGSETDLHGDDLKISGEGMKGFYDKILPKAVSKYLKQFKAKVGTTEVQSDDDPESIVFHVVLPNGKVVASRDSMERAEATAKSFEGAKVVEVPLETTEVWNVELTDSLKQDVEAGQPRYSVGPAQGAQTDFRLPDPQRDAAIDFAVKLLNGEKVNRERGQRIIDRMYPGADATSALFTAHGLHKQLRGQWERVRSESLTEAYQLLARTETALTATEQGINVLNDARRRFEEEYLKGTKDKEVRDAAEARRREQAEKANALSRDELEDEGLWITDPVAQLDIPEETLKPRDTTDSGEEDAGVEPDANQEVTDAEVEAIVEIPQEVDEYLRNIRDAVQVKTGLQLGDHDFLRAYRATLQQAVRGSVRALTYSRARESLLRQADKLGDLTQISAIESRAGKILFKTFQSATAFDRKGLVRDLEKRVRKALGKRAPKVTGSWTKNKLDAAVDRYFRKLRSTKYDIVEPDPETGKEPRGRRLMDLPLEIVEQRIDMIQNELDTGLEAYYKNEHSRKSISDKIAEMQEDLELLQRYGGLKYKTLAEIQEVFDTTEMELDEALRIQAERKELRNKQMEERSALIIDAVGAARGKMKRSKLEEAKDEWTAYELSLYGRLQDLIKYAEKSDPKTYNALWNRNVVITPEQGIDELWSLSALARDIDTASHGIRIRKHEAHKQLLDTISRIYGSSNAFQAEGKIHELLQVRDEYRKYSKQDNKVPLSKAHLIQFIAYMDQEWYLENAELHGRLEDYDAIKAELSSQDLRLLDWMRGFYAEQRPELSDKKKQITGLGFPADIDPLYMPVSVKNYGGGLAGIHTSLQITPAIMTDRRKHKNDLNENLDVFAIFFDRVHQNAVYLELAETALDVAELFGRKDLQETISKVYGDKYKDRLYEHLYDVISQKPLTYKAKGTEKFMLAYGAMVMNFNLGPAARQPSSGFAFAFDHGMGEVAGWNLQWLSPGANFNPDHKEFIQDMLNSDQAAARFEGGASYEMASMFEAEGVTALKRIFKKYGMAPNKYIDMLTIAYVGSHVYRKYYEQLVNQGSSREAAKEKAMEWTWSEVERHQQSSFLQNQAPWQRRGGGAQKLMGMFGSTVQQFLAEQNRVLRRAKAAGDYRELVKHTLINHVILPVSYKLLDTAFWALFGRKPDEDEWKEYLALMIMGPLGGKFIFRTIMSYAVDAIIQGKPPHFKDNLVPASGMMRIIGDLTQLAWHTDDPEKLTDLILDVTGGLLPPVRLMEELYDNYLRDED